MVVKLKRWMVVNITETTVFHTHHYWLAKLYLWWIRNDEGILYDKNG